MACGDSGLVSSPVASSYVIDASPLFLGRCHLFYSQRVVDMPDGATKWAGLDGKSERL